MMADKRKTVSIVQLPPPKCRKNLFHVPLTQIPKCLVLQGASGFLFYQSPKNPRIIAVLETYSRRNKKSPRRKVASVWNTNLCGAAYGYFTCRCLSLWLRLPAASFCYTGTTE